MQRPIGRAITDLAAQDPDAPAVSCGGATLTRGELERHSNRLARVYEDLGVREGDFVTVALGNGLEYFQVAVAVWKLGAVPQPVSPRLPEIERHAIIELADPALIVGVEPGEHPGRRCLPAHFVAPDDVSDAPIEPDRVSPSWKAMTSGGSTGMPKLIVEGTPGLVDSSGGGGTGASEHGVIFLPGPMYHNMPFSWASLSLFRGHHVLILPRFDARAALQAIDDYRVEVVCLVPTMMQRMWRVIEEDPAAFDLGSLRALWHMASPCPEWLKERWIHHIGPEKVRESYAGTEMQAMTMITGSEWLEHRGSVGRATLGEIKIVGEDGADLPAGEIGEIYMRRTGADSPTYRYIGAKARSLDGWESIGDMGRLDDDGYLYLADRRSDLILSGGANIYPAEVEAALLSHELVESAIVVGLPDEDLGQRVHAVVHATGALDTEALVAHLAERLVRYKIPRSFRFVEEPLRDDAGKARRLAIRDAEAALLDASG